MTYYRDNYMFLLLSGFLDRYKLPLVAKVFDIHVVSFVWDFVYM